MLLHPNTDLVAGLAPAVKMDFKALYDEPENALQNAWNMLGTCWSILEQAELHSGMFTFRSDSHVL